MPNAKLRVPENVPGDFFVDTTCIDCDACRPFWPCPGNTHSKWYSASRRIDLADSMQGRAQ